MRNAKPEISDDPMESWPRVVVVGPGAVGAYFGGMLARAGAPVTMLGRPDKSSPHLKAMARDGLRLDAVHFQERVPVETATGARTVRDADLVLFCVKTVDTDEAGAQIAPHVGPDCIVADLQNGVDNPERLRAAGVDPVPAAVYVAAAVEAPGMVKHRARGDLVIGHPTRTDDVRRLAGWLERAGIGCVVSDDVEHELWRKLIVNSMGNATSALTNASYGDLAAFEPTWKLAKDVAREAVAVARAAGKEFDLDHVIADSYAICRSVGPATSSTQQDISAGRATEIDSLNGYIARRGAELGVDTPVNQALWALVKLRERARPIAL